jgi:hypothetical protein
VLRDGSAVSFRELFDLLETDSSFARWYAGELAARGRRAFFWEHPAITRASCDHPAEFVLVDGEPLEALRPDPGPFRSHFDSDSQPDDDVAVFPNLGGDALLLAPRPLAAAAAYPHLAVFLREAPPAQVRNLLGAVGEPVGAAALAEHRRDGRTLGPRPDRLAAQVLPLRAVQARTRRTPMIALRRLELRRVLLPGLRTRAGTANMHPR